MDYTEVAQHAMNHSQQAKDEIFEQASRLSGIERDSYLQRATSGDERLRQEIEGLLSANERAGTFLEEPMVVSAGTIAITTAMVAVTEKAGDRIGRYKLLEQIGEGGCGVVYVAEQEEPVRRRVALKIVKLGMDTKQVVARFEAERQALALMDHPNIAKVLDGGTTERGRPYFVMELVRGIKATDYCDKHSLSTEARLQLFIQICSAIQHAHQKGIIHRDIKPSNILVTVHDGVPVPKVIDFGIAKATTDQRLTDKTIYTAFEQFIGTPAYMSPEQAEMSGLDVDTRSDIYSLGVLLYELLTGRTPFDASTLLRAGLDQMRRIIREQDPPKPSTRLSTLEDSDLSAIANHRRAEPPKLINLIRGDLDWIVMKALEKDRTRRYETVNALAMDVKRHITHDPVMARPSSVLYQWGKFTRRNRGLVASAVAVFVVLLISAIGMAVLYVRAERLRLEATRQTRIADEQRHRASDEAEVVQAVNGFLQNDLLSQVNMQVQAYAGWEPDPNLTVRQVLDRAAKTVESRFRDRPLVEAGIRFAIGNAYRGVGAAPEGVRHLQRALTLRAGHLGTNDDLTLNTMFDLGLALTFAHRHSEAISLLDDLVKIQTAKHGSTNWETLHSLERLGGAYLSADRPTEAIPILERTVNLSKSLNDPWLPFAMADLGTAYRQAARMEEAVKMHEEALKLRRATIGTTHPDTLWSMELLADTYRRMGRLQDSEALYREIVTLWRKRPVSTDLIRSIRNLADWLTAAKRFEESEALLREVWSVCLNRFPTDTALRQSLSLQIALLLRGQEKWSASEPFYREAVAGATSLWPDEIQTWYWQLTDLAAVLRNQGKSEEAENYYWMAVTNAQRLWPTNFETWAPQVSDLSGLLASQGKSQQLELLLKQLKPVLHGEPQEAGILANLARIYRNQEKWSLAEPHYREAVELSLKRWPADAARWQWIVADLGLVLRAQGKLGEAEVYYRAAVTNAFKLWPTNFQRWAWQLADLTELLANRGKSDEIELLLNELKPALRGQTQEAEIQASLARIYRNQQKWSTAEPFFREALSTFSKRWPDDVGRWQGQLAGLGLVLKAQGKLGEAEIYYRAAVTNAAKLWPTNFQRWGWQARDFVDLLLSQNKITEAIETAESINVLQSQPGAVDLLRMRGRLHARLGRWETAASDFTNVCAFAPDDALDSMQLAALLVKTDRIKQYFEQRQRMIAQFGSESDPGKAELIAKAMLIIPAEDPLLEVACRLANVAVQWTNGNAALPYFRFTRALADYRQNNFGAAIEWAQKASALKPDDSQLQLLTQSVLAMANKKLQRAEEAERALATAKEIETRISPTIGHQALGLAWHDWLIGQTLLGEARTTMVGESSATRPQK